jgi:hypothetical protein
MMAQSTFQGPIKSGTIRENLYVNTGNVLMMQYWTFDIPNLRITAPNGVTTAMTAAAGSFNSIIYVPSNSVITDIYADVDTAYNQGTSAAATVGTTSGGTQYVTTMDLSAAGRVNPTFTGAQLLAMNSAAATSSLNALVPYGESTSAIYLRITSVGTAASTGHGFVYVFYQQV